MDEAETASKPPLTVGHAQGACYPPLGLVEGRALVIMPLGARLLNTVTPAQRSLARWLLQQDVTPEDGRAVAEAAARAWEKLSPRLAHVFTVAGSRGLAKRAIYLAQRDFTLLRGAEGEAGLDGLSSAMAKMDKSEAEQVAEAVLANIIALTVTFIGEDLSLRAIRDVWPDAPSREEDQPRQEVSL